MLLDQSSDLGKGAIDLFTKKYADDLEKIFKTDKYFKGVDSIVVFGEYFGAKSFAGMHHADDTKDFVLFDVSPHKKGMMGPAQFLDLFGHLDVAELLYNGPLSHQMILNIREGLFDSSSKRSIRTLVPEGVICKGGDRHDLWMCKIKTHAYLAKLKERYKDDCWDYWE